MPTYEYVCKSCGHLFEIVQSMRDDPLTECPVCTGELRKVFAPPAISFKGSGFYATDHRKSSKKTSERTTTEPDKAGNAKPEAGSSEAPKKESTPDASGTAAGPAPKEGASP